MKAATAFQGVKPSIVKEARSATLDLYRSLLKAAAQFPESHQRYFLRETVRERFRFHRHETSRPRVLRCLQEGSKALEIMWDAKSNAVYMERIDALATAKAGPLKHVVGKLRRIPDLNKRASAALDIRSSSSRKRDPNARMAAPEHLCKLARITQPAPYQPPSQPTKTPKFTKRKPYMVSIRTHDANGIPFIRVRGWRQPVQTSMMIKTRVKKLQQWMDKIHELQDLRRMIRSERIFYTSLGIHEDFKEYEYHMTEAERYYSQLRSRIQGNGNDDHATLREE
ncbi:hypothetical protein O0I10_004067 [Lichtheimia ornata]|uniref:Complex 1 LYR protein domain-containing protein n=1 Tax=Lichtheimia ornata TaxID=688661 RepID=A0AAD7V6X4_9FUNG|nr:uncharacterized protein O0I10_004067 [Lichtheimia ornata]KAJ8660207.1 hypothetical protein O0I10_004067 [Lichtheimia ornata]